MHPSILLCNINFRYKDFLKLHSKVTVTHKRQTLLHSKNGERDDTKLSVQNQTPIVESKVINIFVFEQTIFKYTKYYEMILYLTNILDIPKSASFLYANAPKPVWILRKYVNLHPINVQF